MKQKYYFLLTLLLIFAPFTELNAQEKLTESKLGLQVLDYIEQSKALAYLTKDEIDDIQIDQKIFSKNSSVTHIYLYQTYNGIKIHNAISNVAIKNNKIFHFKDNFISNVERKITVKTPTLKPVQAIEKAASYFDLHMTASSRSIQKNNNKNLFSNKSISQESIPVELMYFKNAEGNLTLVWDLSLFTPDSKHWWSVRMDATTGAVLQKDDWVTNCSFGATKHTHKKEVNTVEKNEKAFNFEAEAFVADGSQYNVIPLPAESPNHGGFQVVTEPANSDASPFGWHDTDGQIGAEFTITRGNNVWSRDDLNADNQGGTSPDGTASLDFNIQLNTLDQEASSLIDLATVNLFYHSNIVHDIFYQYGFDEASGNFQSNNYGKGGLGDDAVLADVQDGSGTNNANFATPPDGNNPRMQMFIWNVGNQSSENLQISGTNVSGNYISVDPSTALQDGVQGNLPGPTLTPVTGSLVVVNDGTEIPEEGCQSLINSAEVAGNIVIIRRGSCTFVDKIQNAQDAGAIGVIVANHNNPTNDPAYNDYVNMYGSTDPALTIPSLFINYQDGQTLIDAVRSGLDVTATIQQKGPFPVDSSFDNGIVIHEYGHGISTRLTGGARNAGCLDNNFQMGEGWSDWFALMLTMKASDVGDVGRGIGTYVSGEDVNGQGIRTRQYSTDFSINEYTFADTNNEALNERVHYNGTLWATFLWDLTWSYIGKYGFNADLYNGNGGNNRVLALVIEGLKLQGCRPDFIDGRDGLLAADEALTGGENQCLIWEVFAKRGMGVDASRGSRDITTDQVESFDTPDASDISLVNCTTLNNEVFNASVFKVFPNPAGDFITIKMEETMQNVSYNLVDLNGRLVVSKRANNQSQTTLDISALQAGIYILKIESNTGVVSRKIIKN